MMIFLDLWEWLRIFDYFCFLMNFRKWSDFIYGLVTWYNLDKLGFIFAIIIYQPVSQRYISPFCKWKKKCPGYEVESFTNLNSSCKCDNSRITVLNITRERFFNMFLQKPLVGKMIIVPSIVYNLRQNCLLNCSIFYDWVVLFF